jgi:hypothetical protein
VLCHWPSQIDAGDKKAEQSRNAHAKAAKGKRRPRPSTSLHELFALLDANGDGELTLDEVVAAHGQLGLTAQEAKALFAELDVDGSGTLTRVEMSFIGSLVHKIKAAPRLSFALPAARHAFARRASEPTGKRRPLPVYAAEISSFVYAAEIRFSVGSCN